MRRAPIVGWVLYDLANTIFSFVVVTRYFNDWIVDERGQPDYAVGLMTAAVSVALVFTLPLVGARADRTGRHMPVLIAFTLLSVGATALLGVVQPVLIALAVGALATFAFNVADSQYHPLLAVVSPDAHRRGRISGIGVALGYIGSLLALVVIGAIVTDGHAQRAFLPAAAMFGVFAIPCFVLVREHGKPPAAHTAARPFGALAASVRRARTEPYGRLLLARFFYVDAIATVIQFITVYARRTGDFDGGEIDALLAVATVVAIGGALGAGLIAERVGPRLVVRRGARGRRRDRFERGAVGAGADGRDRARLAQRGRPRLPAAPRLRGAPGRGVRPLRAGRQALQRVRAAGAVGRDGAARDRRARTVDVLAASALLGALILRPLSDAPAGPALVEGPTA